MFYGNVPDGLRLAGWTMRSIFTFYPEMKEAAPKREFELGNGSALYIIMIGVWLLFRN